MGIRTNESSSNQHDDERLSEVSINFESDKNGVQMLPGLDYRRFHMAQTR